MEFAAEFPDMTELNLAGGEMSFVQYHSLDVIVPFILLLITVLCVVIAALKAAVIHLVPSLTGRLKRRLNDSWLHIIATPE